MMPNFRFFLPYVTLILAGCNAIAPTGDRPATTPETTNTATEAIGSETTPSAPNRLETAVLSPQPIRISAANLPEPFHSDSVAKPPQVVPIPDRPILNVPEGFEVNIFAEGLTSPRWLALTPTGDVLVTETPNNQIRRLRDTDGDGVADEQNIFADRTNGLNLPFGMAFTSDSFFLGNTGEIRRFNYQNGQPQLTGTGEKIADLPGEGYRQHWTRNVIVSPDGQQLYVSVGSRSNVDREELPRASVQVMNLDGSQVEIFAFGLRNPVGLDFHPITGKLYTTVNERDGLGNDLVPDYLTGLNRGEFYGWPYAYFSPQNLDPRRTVNGRSEAPELVQKTKMPDVLFQAHSAALGLQFYDGESFPERYHNGAFVAFRGSWNRDRATGYKLVFVPFDENGQPQDYYEDFLTGFLANEETPTTWGRPVSVLVLNDGSLLFTEESNNRIYRIQYRP
jgi:glucose/arabinose dehydrogenase